GLLFALAPNREFRCATRSQVADLLGKLADIVDRLTVQCGDDIAGEDASLRGRAVRERFGDQRAFVFLHTEAFGDIRGNGLDLHADPPPASMRRAVTAELMFGNKPLPVRWCCRCARVPQPFDPIASGPVRGALRQRTGALAS